jgi:hypothetical protein
MAHNFMSFKKEHVTKEWNKWDLVKELIELTLISYLAVSQHVIFIYKFKTNLSILSCYFATIPTYSQILCRLSA